MKPKFHISVSFISSKPKFLFRLLENKNPRNSIKHSQIRMYDHMPFEIQVEIIKKLPIKPLIRFRSVSKPWKSLIDSSQFIADYNSQSQRRLLVGYRDKVDYELKSVLIDDDDSFPQRKCSLDVPLFFKFISKLEIIGSSRGLLCLHGYYDGSTPKTGENDVVLWNPAIRKSVVIKMPNDDELNHQIKTVVGFGVCPLTNDPKLVKINHIGFRAKLESISCIPSQVEVFTLSSRAWRTPSGNLPRKSICFQRSHIVIGGFIYWAAFDVDEVYRLSICFDLTTEEFKEIYLPKSIAQPSSYDYSISKLRDSLVVLECSDNGENLVFGVWMMEHGVPNSFTKLFTVDAPNGMLDKVLEFRENGEPMFEMGDMYDFFSATIDVYEPSSKHIKGLRINGLTYSFFVSSYMETLMMLDQPDIL